MRMQRTSLAKSLADYYHRVEHQRVPVTPDPCFSTKTQCVPTAGRHQAAAERDGHGKELRKLAVRRWLLREHADAELAIRVMQDIDVEPSCPMETEILLLPSSETNQQMRQFSLLEPRHNAAEEQKQTDEHRVDESAATSRCTDRSDRNGTLVQKEDRVGNENLQEPSLSNSHVLVQRISNSALKRYRNLDGLAKSVSWNDDDLRELELHKSKSGGLKKSVSWKDEHHGPRHTGPSSPSRMHKHKLDGDVAGTTRARHVSRKQSISEVLNALRSIREIASLADSFSLATDADENRKDTVAYANHSNLGGTAPKQISQNQPCNKTMSSNGRTGAKRGAMGTLRSLWTKRRGTNYLPKARKCQHHVAPHSQGTGRSTKSSSKHDTMTVLGKKKGFISRGKAAKNRPYSTFEPIDGLGSMNSQELSELKHPAEHVQGRFMNPSLDERRYRTKLTTLSPTPSDLEIITPPSLEAGNLLIARPSSKHFVVNGRRQMISAQRVNHRGKNDFLIPGAIAREAEEIREDIEDLRETVFQEIERDFDVCANSRFSCSPRLDPELDDVSTRSGHESELASGRGNCSLEGAVDFDGLGMSDSSSDILDATNSSSTISATDSVGPRIEEHGVMVTTVLATSILDMDGRSDSTMEQSLHEMSSALTVSTSFESNNEHASSWCGQGSC